MSRVYAQLPRPIPVRELPMLVPGVYERSDDRFANAPVLVLAVNTSVDDHPTVLEIFWSFINEIPAFSRTRVAHAGNMFADDWQLIGEFVNG